MVRKPFTGIIEELLVSVEVLNRHSKRHPNPGGPTLGRHVPRRRWRLVDRVRPVNCR